MTDHDDQTQDDQQVHDYLQSRIPEPGANYWEAIDARLRGEPAPEPSVVDDVGDQGHIDEPDTDASVVRPMSMNTSSSMFSGRNLLIAAAALVLAGIGVLALANRSGEEPVGLATATEDPTAIPVANDADADSGDEGADATGDAVEAEPASPEDAAELMDAMDASPLLALQVRLNGTTDTPAGPYCFSHPDSYIFPADELDDRRALLQLDIAGDGFANFTAMQGETIVITGSGYPDASGTLLATPVAVVDASGAPPYEIQIGDDHARS